MYCCMCLDIRIWEEKVDLDWWFGRAVRICMYLAIYILYSSRVLSHFCFICVQRTQIYRTTSNVHAEREISYSKLSPLAEVD